MGTRKITPTGKRNMDIMTTTPAGTRRSIISMDTRKRSMDIMTTTKLDFSYNGLADFHESTQLEIIRSFYIYSV